VERRKRSLKETHIGQELGSGRGIGGGGIEGSPNSDEEPREKNKPNKSREEAPPTKDQVLGAAIRNDTRRECYYSKVRSSNAQRS